MPISISGSAAAGGATGPETAVVRLDQVTLGSHYEAVANYLKLAAVKDFSVTIANAISTAPAGWTWSNSGLLDSADANTTTANALSADFGTSTTTTYSASPFLYKTYQPPAGKDTLVFVARIAHNGDADFERMGLMVAKSGTLTTNAVIFSQYNTGARSVASLYDDSNVLDTDAVGATQLSDGVWMMITVSEGATAFWYSNTVQATPPAAADWVYSSGRAANFAVNDVLLGGIALHAGNASDNFVGNCLYYDDTLVRGKDIRTKGNPISCASGFDQGNTEIQLLADYDLVSATSTIADADLQSIFGFIENIEDEADSSWTYSVVRDAATSAASSTYQAAGSITVSGTGRYLNVFAKCNSDGTQPGNLLFPINIPYTLV